MHALGEGGGGGGVGGGGGGGIFGIIRFIKLPGNLVLRPYGNARLLQLRIASMTSNNSCNIILSIPLLEVVCATNGVSVLVCLLASILVFRLKFHRKVLYRLALYQVSAALVFSVVQVFQIVFVNYSKDTVVYSSVCAMIAFLSVYTQWAKLVLTIWVTVYLFCFAVLHKNLKKLEVLCVVTSLLVPSAIAGVALGINSYGLGEFGCWIDFTCRNNNSSFVNLFLERLVLWDGPATVILFVASTVMIMILIKLSCNLYQHGPISSDNQYWKAFKQLLPLAAFPMIFYVFIVPQFAFHVYQFQFEAQVTHLPRSNSPLYMVTAISFSLWSFASGLTLIMHICVATLSRYCKDTKVTQARISCRYGTVPFDGDGSATIRIDAQSNSNSATSFSLPKGSITDDNII